ncbi:MAG: hypothetical protein M1834_006238 [Cirrosporium novae-zelandiae]|nr:MAG: hypothetical protein M1834_006238 [Cirrosporium novae-zelandiae]
MVCFTIGFWPFATTAAEGVIYVILLGVFIGAIVSLSGVCMVEVVGSCHHILNQWSGMTCFCSAVPALLG